MSTASPLLFAPSLHLASDAKRFAQPAKALPLGLLGVDDVLPDAGLPRGAVVEIAAPRGLARATTLALAACAAAQAQARLRGVRDTEGAWCAWIDAHGTLSAPAVARSGVDLTRLLVVRPPRDALSRVAVRVASSRAFAVVVIDVASVPGAGGQEAHHASRPRAGHADMSHWSTAVRRLALAAEGSDTVIVMITDRLVARSMPLPVAMRIELESVAGASSSRSTKMPGGHVTLRVAKDRRGRVTAPTPIILESA